MKTSEGFVFIPVQNRTKFETEILHETELLSSGYIICITFLNPSH